MAIVATGDRYDDVLIETPLVSGETVNGAVDYKGRPVMRSKSGGWRSAWFLIGVEATERLAYYGIQSNLMVYLTEQLQQSTGMAAKKVNAWNGTASLLPLFGPCIADSCLGRYRTILIASYVHILGLRLLTFSTMLPSLSNSTQLQLQLFLLVLSLYLIAFGQGGHKPCTQAFGADQFDENHPKETKQRSSFFNWWTFFICAFGFLTLWILNYIQDNLSWVLRFGIPCLLMIISLLIFLLGTNTYRFVIGKKDNMNPFLRIGRVFVVALRNWRTNLSDIAIKEQTCATLPHPSSQQFSFLNKALLAPNGSKKEEACSLSEVEEAKVVLRLAPIWATSLVFGIVYAQVRTFFTKQGVTMERTLFPGFDIPAASLQSLISLAAIVISGLIYDRIFIPIARAVTMKPSGMTMLQRIGTGVLLSLITIVIAALVEMKRLKTAKEYGLVDEPNATIPMNVWWLIPQYFLLGIAEFFTVVGLQEFFYDQVPKELRSIDIALYLSIIGVGSFLSSFLISVIEKVTGRDGHNSWFANNLNQAHPDYFYWLLVGLTMMGFALFILFAKSYIYNRR